MPRIFAALLLLLSFSAALADMPRAIEQLNPDPPRIVVSDRPSRLMLIDGPPALVEIPATDLSFVVNTDWDVFQHRGSGVWYVLDNGVWLIGNMLSSGDWRVTTVLPDDFLTLQVSSDWPRVASAMPARDPGVRPLPIVISYEPTELIIVDGDMEFDLAGGGGLQYVKNTERDLFRYDGRYYFLAAGRWFTTKNVNRMWYAVKELPAAFAEIPQNHPRARVLESVPGTEAARRAAAEAARPRITEVQAGAGKALEVPWLGSPEFVEIEGTSLRRGKNTPFQVIQNNNFFYLCHDGAWFFSAAPTGPWRVALEVPEAIYTIPPTDPAFNVTFVKLESFDDSSGRTAYVSTSGYYSRYYNGSTMVYGTGWYYPGFYDRSVYWRYPHTYGYYGPWGAYYPYRYHSSETFEIDNTATDWEWELDGSKRKVYNYGPRNDVGGKYRMP
ncbi:MAG: hypothetical protein PVI83_01490 [Lysobacterales bacterium]|jgi:hypothetical protein